MRGLLSFLALASGLLSITPSLAETRYVATDNSTETKLCVSAATDHRMSFTSKVEVSGIRPKVVANKLYCNDVPVVKFAAMAGNERNTAWLQRYHHQKTYVEIRDVSLNDSTPSDAKDNDRIVYIGGSLIN